MTYATHYAMKGLAHKKNMNLKDLVNMVLVNYLGEENGNADTHRKDPGS